MKLLRYGPQGAEKPGLLDAGGKLRDLSGLVGDIGGATLSDEGLDRLRRLDTSKLPEVDPSVRLDRLADHELLARVLGDRPAGERLLVQRDEAQPQALRLERAGEPGRAGADDHEVEDPAVLLGRFGDPSSDLVRDRRRAPRKHRRSWRLCRAGEPHRVAELRRLPSSVFRRRRRWPEPARLGGRCNQQPGRDRRTDATGGLSGHFDQ